MVWVTALMIELGEQQENCKLFSEIWMQFMWWGLSFSSEYEIYRHHVHFYDHLEGGKDSYKSKPCRYINEGGYSEKTEALFSLFNPICDIWFRICPDLGRLHLVGIKSFFAYCV